MKKVLVIEDEKLILSSLLTVLKLHKFNVIGAENGLVGIKLASELLPNLILCDVKMPILDGYGVLRELKSNPLTIKIPFIFMSGQVNHVEINQFQQMGANNYLTKPFDSGQLIQEINKLLEI